MRLDTELLPVTETSLSHYFTKRLTRYAKRFRPPPHEDTCWYIGSLLDRLGRSEQLFAYEENRLTLRPLALFPKRYARHGIGRDYFIGMGGSAYDYLADNARRNRHIFAELAGTFTRTLEMVANACARTQALGTEEVLALYQHWLDSRDPLAARQLRALGTQLSGTGRLQ